MCMSYVKTLTLIASNPRGTTEFPLKYSGHKNITLFLILFLNSNYYLGRLMFFQTSNIEGVRCFFKQVIIEAVWCFFKQVIIEDVWCFFKQVIYEVVWCFFKQVIFEVVWWFFFFFIYFLFFKCLILWWFKLPHNLMEEISLTVKKRKLKWILNYYLPFIHLEILKFKGTTSYTWRRKKKSWNSFFSLPVPFHWNCDKVSVPWNVEWHH